MFARRAGVADAAEMKKKVHRFTLTVRTNLTKKQAETAVLHAFAKRNPDACEFHLTTYPAHKEIWMEGSMSGAMVVLDMIEHGIHQLRIDCAKGTKRRAAK